MPKRNLKKYLFPGALASIVIISSVLTVADVSQTKIEEVRALSTPLLSKYQGYTLRFNAVNGATKYVVFDDNDYRESIELLPSDADADGYLYYTTEVVGNHQVYIEAHTPDGVLKSNVVDAVENLPVFDYGLATPVHFYDIRDGSSGTYTIVKENATHDGVEYDYVTQADFNANYIYNQQDIIDLTSTSVASHNITNIMAKAKAMGSNIVRLVNRFCDIESGSQWWWGGSFENSVCKEFMDIAWSMGLKSIVSDFPTYSSSKLDNGPTIAASRVVNAEVKKVAQHPGFYGFELGDEPLPVIASGQTKTEIQNSADVAAAILAAWRSDSQLKLLPEPYIHCELSPYNETLTCFPDGLNSYQDYLELWLTASQTSDISFDAYAYTCFDYGQYKVGPFYARRTIYFDPTRVNYTAINNLRALYPNLRVNQTLTRCNHTAREDLNAAAVYGSTFLAASQGNFGYSTYTLSPSNASHENECLDINYQTTQTFTWGEDAASQYRIIQGLLDGYQMSANTITNYASDGYEGYGETVRVSDSTFNDEAGKTLQFVVNFNTSSTNTNQAVTVPNGKKYHLFGQGFNPLTINTGTGADVNIGNGKAILIVHDEAAPVENIAKTVTLGCRYSIGQSGNVIADSDKFCVQISLENAKMSQLASVYEAYGIYVSTATKAVHFNQSQCVVETDNKTFYLVLNLGAVLTNNLTKDVFTVKVYGLNGSTYTYSSDELQFSVASLVSDLYNNPSTRASVTWLYQYMQDNDLL